MHQLSYAALAGARFNRDAMTLAGMITSTVRKALLIALLVAVGPGGGAIAQTAAEATRLVDQAEATYRQGRTDYLLVRRALEAADASGDLRVRARANLLQARVDSAENRRTKAYPFFQRARELNAEADRQEASTALTDAQAAAVAAEAARDSAFVERDRIATEAEAVESVAQTKLITAIAAGVAAFVLLGLIFYATVRRLRGEIARARSAQDASEAGYAKVRAQIVGVARDSLQRLRRFVRVYAQRIPGDLPGSGASQLAAHDAALHYLSQSSYETGDSYELAVEAWCERVNPDLARLLGSAGATLRTEAMPLRLAIDQGAPFVLLYTELAGYALARGSSAVRISIAKEGTGVTMTVADTSGRQASSHVGDDDLKYARALAEELGGRLEDAAAGEPHATVLRFNAYAGRPGVVA